MILRLLLDDQLNLRHSWFNKADFFHGKKRYLQESFYRMMRKRFVILMENGKPIGGAWNFDPPRSAPPSWNRSRYGERMEIYEFGQRMAS